MTNNRIIECNEFFYVGYDGRNKFRKPKLFVCLGFPICDSCLLGMWRVVTPKRYIFGVYGYWVPLVCSKTFPVGCTQDTEKPPFWLWLHSRQYSRIFHSSRVCHWDRVDLLYITGFMVHFYRATLCVSAVFAVVRCLSVCLSRRWIVCTRLKISSNFFLGPL